MSSTVPQYLTIGHSSTKFAVEDPALAGPLASAAGYPATEISTHQPQLITLETRYQHQQDLLAVQKRATDAFGVAFTGIESDLSLFRSVLNDNFSRPDPIFTQVGLDQPQPEGQTDVLIYASRAFTNAANLPAAQIALLERRTWTADRLKTLCANVTAAQALNDAQESAKSDAVAATSQLYDLIDEFDGWFRPFAKAARRVLAKVPGALTKMGLADGLPNKPRRPTEKNPARKLPMPPAA